MLDSDYDDYDDHSDYYVHYSDDEEDSYNHGKLQVTKQSLIS